MRQTGEPHKAAAALAALFTRAKQLFAPAMAPIQVRWGPELALTCRDSCASAPPCAHLLRVAQTASAPPGRIAWLYWLCHDFALLPLQESKVDAGPKRRGRPGKASKQAGGAKQAAEEEQGAEAAAALPEGRWGEAPARLSSVGMEEDEAAFGTRLRQARPRAGHKLACSRLVRQGGRLVCCCVRPAVLTARPVCACPAGRRCASISPALQTLRQRPRRGRSRRRGAPRPWRCCKPRPPTWPACRLPPARPGRAAPSWREATSCWPSWPACTPAPLWKRWQHCWRRHPPLQRRRRQQLRAGLPCSRKAAPATITRSQRRTRLQAPRCALGVQARRQARQRQRRHSTPPRQMRGRGRARRRACCVRCPRLPRRHGARCRRTCCRRRPACRAARWRGCWPRRTR